MAFFLKFPAFLEALAGGKHNFENDVVKLLLTNTQPSASDTAINFSGAAGVLNASGAKEISAGNGYPAGGVTVSKASSGMFEGKYLYRVNPAVFQATGTVGPFQCVVAYNASAGNPSARPVISWYLIGHTKTMLTGDTLTFQAANGVLFTIS